jgi:hypothetical protein
VAELVEDAVVRQMVLVVPRDHAASVDDRRGVRGRVLGCSELVRDVLRAGQVPDDDDEVAEALVIQSRRELVDCLLRCGDERRSVGHVLDRVTGQHHLGEHDEVGIALGSVAARREDELGVAVEVADAGVHLGEGEAQLGHVTSVSTGRGECAVCGTD